MNHKNIKPLNRQAYGSIGHLPNSRLGPGDHCINPGMARICLEACRKGDMITVQEKLDGSNVAVVKLEGIIIPIIRAGYRAVHSNHEQHRLFDRWVFENLGRFESLLEEGERICGEWLAQAHGTRYNLPHEPFVAFDLIKPAFIKNKNGERWEDRRAIYNDFISRIGKNFVTPRLLYSGPASFSIESALKLLEDRSYHGALDEIEGAVWRVEREGRVDFLAKYVRPTKVDGCYFPLISGKEEVWNWRPV